LQLLEISLLGAIHTFDETCEVIVGRGEASDVIVDDERVSRRHLLLTFVNGRWRAADAGSTNGTFHDGSRITTVVLPVRGSLWLAHPTNGIELRLVAPEDGYATVRLADDPGHSSLRSLLKDQAETQIYGLTAREEEVIALVAGGATDAQIATALFISVRTVRSHLDRVQRKTGRRRRFDILRLAGELGIQPTTSPTHGNPV
jgi:DNA-binding CsgD family transcriptional regulator